MTSGGAGGAFLLVLTSDWIGKEVLQFIPVYNRWQHKYEFTISRNLNPISRKYTAYKERDW